MTKKISVLHVEDNIADFELIKETLIDGGINVDPTRVETKEDFLRELKNRKFDLIISDYSLPSFNGKAALMLAKEFQSETPFVFISGTIGEEFAVESLHQGASDYLIKNNLRKLVPAIRRTLDETEEKKKRKIIEKELLEREQFIQKITDTTPNIIYVYDLRKDELVWINNSIQPILGFTVDEVKKMEKIAEHLLHPEDHKKFIEIETWHIPSRGGEIIDFTYRVKNSSGNWRWLLSRTTIFTTDDERKPVQILGVADDITDKMAMEAQLFRTQRLESIGQLAGGIAHDLNNVFGPMLLAIPLLQRVLKEDPSKKILGMMESSIHRGTNMVKQILMFARGNRIETSMLHPKQIIQEMENIMKETFPKSIDIRVSLDEKTDSIQCDLTQLHQVLLNLCVNARDAMPSGGVLTVSTKNILFSDAQKKQKNNIKPGPYVLIAVEDTGNGIPPEILEKIFEPFFTTKDIGKGTGLGLSTVNSIVQNHNGFLEVESTVGKGTTFKIYLPSTSMQKQPLQGKESALPLGHNEMIMVIDDESLLLQAAKEALESSNYRAITAHDGAEAVSMFAKLEGEIQVVVCDLNMPLMDGQKTIQLLKKLKPSLRVIIASGNLHLTRAESVSAEYSTTILQKPYTVEKLLNAVQTALTA